jgi:hypothetical protein
MLKELAKSAEKEALLWARVVKEFPEFIISVKVLGVQKSPSPILFCRTRRNSCGHVHVNLRGDMSCIAGERDDVSGSGLVQLLSARCAGWTGWPTSSLSFSVTILARM